MENNRRPILYKGEIYTKPITKRVGGSSKEPALSYDVARTKILSDITQTREKLSTIPADKKLPHEFVVCVRMHPEFSAKSYYPGDLFSAVSRNGEVEEIGSRIWRENSPEEDGIEETGKLFFVRTTERGLNELEQKISQEEAFVTKGFAYDVRTIKSVDTLESEEQILGIPSDWTEGRLEAVLHPFEKDKEEALNNFLELLKKSGVDLGRVRYKQYESGITFVSLYGTKKTVATVAEYNPLRTLHTMDLRDLPTVSRGGSISGGPTPASGEKADVVVGIFDGGVKEDSPYLQGFVENEDLTTEASADAFINHGTQVSGAVLFGAINNYSASDTLPTPKVSVKSFRVLPVQNTSDPDLYEIIDEIEETVPLNPHIKVWNLSLGPKGPIVDDLISRFTFACDLLSAKLNVLFTVAVGNDGHLSGSAGRIQAPSDMANGLGIGSYTKKDGKIIRAPYSCKGPGREGNKLKPDLLAFGGCDQHPIHLVAHNLNEKAWNQGTSFASPIVAGYAGQLVGYSDGAIDPLVARALLIHSADSEEKKHSNETGHGILAETVDEIVTCKSNSYTLIYKGELLPKKYAEFTIPWDDAIDRGKVNFRWTIAVSTAIDPQSPDDYTASSVVMTLYPNSKKYRFSKKGERKQVLDLRTESAQVQSLLDAGWEQSEFPVPDSAPAPYAPEDELRADLKWDSVDTRTLGKKIENIDNPFFHIHAFERGTRYKNRKIRFAVVLTVESSEESIDVYSKIVNKYDALVPIKIRVESEVRVENK
ncbi:MAG: hypothetical protein RL150_250 [Candidatus Parcubacteria bacterium]|jgi:hypothetical protein